MTQHSRSRQHAEIAFAEAQTQFFARNRAAEELDSVTLAREEKTLRLKKARLAKQNEDRARATSALIKKRAIKA